MASLNHKILLFSQNKMIERMIHLEISSDYVVECFNDDNLFADALKSSDASIIFLGTKPNPETYQLLEKLHLEREIIKVALLSEEDSNSMDDYLESKFDLIVEAPLQKGEVKNAIHQIIKEKEALYKPNVLLVEDYIEEQKVVLDYLKGTGMQITVANNGLEAIDIILSRDIVFDLVLTNLGMPKMDGFELIRRLKVMPISRAIPIICLTAQNDKDYESKLLDVGASDFIYKPLKPEVLRARSWHHIQAYRDREGLQEEVDRQTVNLKESKQQALVSMEQAMIANKSKSEFISRMSHELRTPLNGILGAAEIMKSYESSSETEEWITMIQHNGHNLLNIINDVLDFSKMDTGNLELELHKFSIHQMIDGLERTFSKELISKCLELKYEYNEDNTEYLKSDAGRLRQILSILISNAIKFSESGQVVIKVDVEIDFEESFLIVQVIDSGVGMSADQIDHLFEAFTQAEDSMTRKEGGAGLGLAIAKGLSKIMGGDLSVTSELNEGSNFRLKIPVQEVQEDTSHLMIENIPSMGLNIYALGQKESFEYRFPCIFESDNYKVTLYESTDRLLRQLDLHPVKCPIVLIDESFENSNSLDVGKRIKEFESSSRCVFTTQEGFRGQNKLVSDFGFSAYLTGGLSAEDFSSLVHQLLQTNLMRILTKYDIIKSSKAKVLLVEDNLISQKITLKILEKMNIECDIAENGEVAFEQYFKKDYDLVLMDIYLPEMNGYEVAQAIKEKVEASNGKYKRVPVVALSAKSYEDDQRQANNLVLSGYFNKPINKEKMNKILKLMNKS